MTIYITAIYNDGVDPFDMKKKDLHTTIVCESIIAAMHVFYIITASIKYRDVVMSSKKPEGVDLNMYDTDTMTSDEYLLSEL